MLSLKKSAMLICGGIVVFLIVFFLVPMLQIQQALSAAKSSCLLTVEDDVRLVGANAAGQKEQCSTIHSERMKLTCEAIVDKNQQGCQSITHKGYRAFCEAGATKNKELCSQDPSCLAFVTGDPSFCEQIADVVTSKSEIEYCKARVQNDGAKLREQVNDCDDESFLVVAIEQDKPHLCQRIQDTVSREFCSAAQKGVPLNAYIV